jgi:diguanylate cyclase (GGDEF)-like protein
LDLLTLIIGVLIGLVPGLLLAVIFWQRFGLIQKEAATDTLTGIYNRAWLAKTLGRLLALAKRDKKDLSVMMIDLNKFKAVNDQFGHQAGDRVLRGVAEATVESLRASDFIFRYGGDEFLVILPQTDSPGAVKVAKKVKDRVSKLSLKLKMPDLGVSVGIASYPKHGEEGMDLVEKADQALYLAKKARDHIEVYS